MPSFPPRKIKKFPIPAEIESTQQTVMESFESIEADLAQAESHVKQPVQEVEESVHRQEPVVTASVGQVSLTQTDPVTEKIEHILEEDLTDLYVQMKPSEQVLFKKKGEETAAKIRELLHQTKVNAKKIFDLLREWFKLIPGINRFFLEQEAKIKTDQILFMNDQDRPL